jgi:hypothetical protein
MVVLATATLLTACGSSQRSSADGAATDAVPADIAPTDVAADSSTRHPFLPLQTCGGSIQASGTSPAGEFVAGSVHVAVSLHCGGVKVVLYDLGGSSRIELDNPLATDGGVGSLLGKRTVDTFFTGPPTFVAQLTSAVIEVTGADDPLTGADAGIPWGMIHGTFALTNDGFSLSGSFESPYCVFDDKPLCTSG